MIRLASTGTCLPVDGPDTRERLFDGQFMRVAVAGAAKRHRPRVGEVVVDITPGRKFMSAIAFLAGIQFEADRVADLHVHSGELLGRVSADLPQRGTTLYDFTDVFA